MGEDSLRLPAAIAILAIGAVLWVGLAAAARLRRLKRAHAAATDVHDGLALLVAVLLGTVLLVMAEIVAIAIVFGVPA